MSLDIFGEALMDYHSGNYTEDIVTHSSLDEKDLMPLPYLFRDYIHMPKLEQKALQCCEGAVLDIGCGAGPHSLWLQKKGLKVTGIDISRGAITICRARGVKNAIAAPILNFDGTRFDTLLLLMNGIGIVGKLKNLKTYLNHFKRLLKEGGQILLDSSNIIYMYDEDEDGGYWIPDDKEYFGEVTFKLGYKEKSGPEFDWLYVDKETLKKVCTLEGFSCEIVMEGEHYDYLARLTPIR